MELKFQRKMENVIGNNLKLYSDVLILSSRIGDNVTLGDNAFIMESSIGYRCFVERRGVVFRSSMGDYSYISYNTVVKSAQIGKFCSISWNVSIGGAEHNYRCLTTHPFPYEKKFGLTTWGENNFPYALPLVIGNDVWIGSSACILRNVKIGNGAIIGAGAVVTHDVGPYEIWAGVPAKKIGQRFPKEVIQELEQLPWWELPERVLKENSQLFREEKIDAAIAALRKLWGGG